MTVDGVPVSREAVTMWTGELRGAIEDTGATFFEATTAMAFADFAARGVDVAVVEVGLGGRLDSTNVLGPVVSGVTHIARDHMKYLGDSLEEIAREKAGIAKAGVPFVIGETAPATVAVLEAVAREEGASVRIVPPAARYEGPLALAGPHQRRNAAVAEALLDALPPSLAVDDATRRAAFATVRVPGRLDRRGRWLFDVAHNPDGMAALVRALEADPPPGPVHALVSILGDKDWPDMLVLLDQVVDRGVLTVAPTAEGRRWDLSWLAAWLARPDRPPARAAWHLEPDFAAALEQAEGGAGTVLVTGSFHTVGDVMAARGLLEPEAS